MFTKGEYMKTVEMTKSEILKTRDVLNNIKETNSGKSIKFQYAVLSNLRKVFVSKAELIEELRNQKLIPIEQEKFEISKMYGELDANGELVIKNNGKNTYVPIPEENKQIVNEKMNEIFSKHFETIKEIETFLNTKEEFEVFDIDVNDCDGIDIKTMDLIYPLLKE